MIGAGGLGCPALLGLVGAGARILTVVDPDRVEADNLHRQVLYGLADVGSAKVLAARRRLAGRVRDLAIRGEAVAVDETSLPDLLDRAPRLGPVVVLECTDDPTTKFLVHDACVRAGIPVVIGAVLGLRGQALLVSSQRGACYRCYYEEPPPPELAPVCAVAGVLGTAAGVVGTFMASLAIAATHDPAAAGRLHVFDLSRTEIRELTGAVRRDCSAPHHRARPNTRRNQDHGDHPHPHSTA